MIPTGAARERPEIRPLTGLRILAALWVFVFHLGAGTPTLPDARWFLPFDALVAEGPLGVDLFFVLSGFVITLTYLERCGPRPSVRGWAGFWWARVSRIWPAFAAVTVIYGAVLLLKRALDPRDQLVYQVVQPSMGVRHWLVQLAMVQLWTHPLFDGTSFDGPTWSISAEALAYLCFPALALVLWRLRWVPRPICGLLGTAAVLPFALLCLRTGDPNHPWSWLLRIAGGFLAGALVCLAVRGVPRTRRVDRAAGAVAAVALAAVVAGAYLLPSAGAPEGPNRPMAVVVLFPVVIGALALSTSGVARLLSTRPFVHGGHISYSFYLVHVPVLEVAWTAMAHVVALRPGHPLFRVLLVAVVVAVLLLAELLYHSVEEPARRWLRARNPVLR